ncbi:alkaline phosphatase family protein [bacterium]|nr:alkaline phosphatase family protein [bacterium]
MAAPTFPIDFKMKKRTKLAFAFLAGLAALQIHAAMPKLVVTIIVDQMRYDYLERFHDQFSHGGFRFLMDHGAFMTSAHYNYCPTVTAPGHASYLSGTPPAVHGIIGNDWFDRQKKKTIAAVYDPACEGVGTTSTNIHVSPLNFIGSNFADQLRLQYQSKVVSVSMKDRAAILPGGKKPNGAYWFESRTGNFITSSYYMSKLPDWLNAFNARALAERYRETNWNRLLPASAYQYPDDGVGEDHLIGETNVVFPHVIHYTTNDHYSAIQPTPFSNELLAELAKAAIEGEHLGDGSVPDLLCISFSAIDLGGHKFGPYSQEMQDLVLRLDRTLEDFFRFLDKRIGLKNCEIVLTADHGVAPLPEFAREYGLDAERVNETTLMTSLSNRLTHVYGTNDLFLSPNFHYGNLYYDFDKLKQRKIKPAALSSTIRKWAFSTGKFEEVYTRTQLLRGDAPGLIGKMVLNGYNAERSGDIVLTMKPYFIPSSGKTGTTHGTPYAYDADIPMLMFGSAFKPGRYAGDFAITDIVPTLCRTLHMDVPPGCIGKPFLAALKEK